MNETEQYLEELSRPGSSELWYAIRPMYDYIVKNNCKKVLELGAGVANSTRALLLAVRETGGHLWSIDIAECPVAVERVKAWNLQDYWTFIVSDDMQYDWKEEVDVLFIDTSHEYNHTLEELRKYARLTKKVIFMHDTISFKEGVQRAIDDFLKEEKNWNFKEVGIEHGLGILERKEKRK